MAQDSNGTEKPYSNFPTISSSIQRSQQAIITWLAFSGDFRQVRVGWTFKTCISASAGRSLQAALAWSCRNAAGMTAGQRRQALILLLRLLAVLVLCMRDARLTPGPAKAGACTFAALQGEAGQPALSVAGAQYLPALADTTERLQGSDDPAEAEGTTPRDGGGGVGQQHQAAQGRHGSPAPPLPAAADGAWQSSDRGPDAAVAAPGSGGSPGGGAAGAALAAGTQGQSHARATPAGSSDATGAAAQAPGEDPSLAAGAEPGLSAAAGPRDVAASRTAGDAERGEPAGGEVPEASAQDSAARPAPEGPAPAAEPGAGAAREEERHNLALAKDGAKVRSCW